MTVIKQDDLIQSVADALQFISYYHPVDFIQAMHEAYLREESPAARDSMAQILINSRMCATGHRPICQDTGIVTVFVRVGMDVRWDGATMGLDDMINEGVRRAYNLPENVLRASILADPAGIEAPAPSAGYAGHDWGHAERLHPALRQRPHRLVQPREPHRDARRSCPGQSWRRFGLTSRPRPRHGLEGQPLRRHPARLPHHLGADRRSRCRPAPVGDHGPQQLALTGHPRSLGRVRRAGCRGRARRG